VLRVRLEVQLQQPVIVVLVHHIDIAHQSLT
jgi:hypothetical protein